jgi:hypothetical protein
MKFSLFIAVIAADLANISCYISYWWKKVELAKPFEDIRICEKRWKFRTDMKSFTYIRLKKKKLFHGQICLPCS